MIKCKLGELLKIKHGYAFKSENYVDKSQYALVTLANISETNNFKFNYEKTTFYGADFPNEVILKTGDLIMPLTEQVIGLIGNSAFVPEINDLTFVLNQRVGKVIYNENKVNKYYLHYLLATQIVKEQLEYRASGTKQRNISPENVYDVTVYIPELEVQNKIGATLYNIENKINTNNKIISELEEMAKTIYDYWFLQYEFPNEEGKPYKSSGGKMVYNEELKKEIPEGWTIKRFKDITDMYQPKTISTNSLKANGKYNVYGANGIIGKYDEYNHEQNEIAVCCRGAACGEYLMTLPFSWITGNAMVIKPKDNNYKEYIFYKLSDKDIFNYITGSAQPQITRTNIENMKIIIPNSLVLEKFNNLGINLRNQIIKFMQENEELTNLRDELLPLLMNGQVSFKN